MLQKEFQRSIFGHNDQLQAKENLQQICHNTTIGTTMMERMTSKRRKLLIVALAVIFVISGLFCENEHSVSRKLSADAEVSWFAYDCLLVSSLSLESIVASLCVISIPE